MPIELSAIPLLQTLPRELQRRGWTCDHRESSVQYLPGASWHDAVYTRPFDVGIDADDLAYVVRGEQVVRVSTIRARSRSWGEARDTAIGLMQDIDAQRHLPNQASEMGP